MHLPVFVQIRPLKPPLRPMEHAARRQQDLALGIAEHQRAVVERIDDAKQLDLEGSCCRLTAQPCQRVLRGGHGLQFGHMRLLGHPVWAHKAARIAHHLHMASARHAAVRVGLQQATGRTRQRGLVKPQITRHAGHEQN